MKNAFVHNLQLLSTDKSWREADRLIVCDLIRAAFCVQLNGETVSTG